MIDFDNSRLADPAIDVGKFLADMEFWHASHNRPGVEEAQESFLAGYARSAPKERLIRARLYQAVKLVKYAVRQVHPFDHDWASRTAWLVGRARAVMKELQLTVTASRRSQSGQQRRVGNYPLPQPTATV